jgi:hyperosmotically inducible periplasmic protein
LKTSLLIICSMTIAAGLAACDRSDDAGARSDASKASGHAADKIASSVQDTAVTTRVKAALLADEQVKGSDITVETSKGAVTLSGQAQSPAQKQRAEQLAMNVDGVLRVNNNITTQQ